MTARNLTADQANAIWNVLVQHAGADDRAGEGPFSTPRDYFVHHQWRGDDEFRFIGSLGFGGKFWNTNGRWYVTAYPEDLTADRQAAVDATNTALETLRKEMTA